MSQYVIDEKSGNWLLYDDGEGQEYDADEHRANLKVRIDNWNTEDIRELKDILEQYHEVERECGVSDTVNYSSLNTQEIPDGLKTYPIWAMDKKGRCLVGEAADSIEDIEDIKEWYKEKNQTTPHSITVTGYEAVEKGVRARGNSGYVYLPRAWEGHRVICIRLD